MKKALVCLLFVLCLVLVSSQEVSAVGTNGTFGEGLSWVFEESTGTLTISGNGSMGDMDYPPWDDHDENILHVIVEEGVTTIGHSAFLGLTVLEDVVLPDSLKEIGSYAFDTCRKLTKITLPDGITKFGTAVFRNSGLEEVTIPKAAKEVGYAMFDSCQSLRKVTLHDGIQKISPLAFNWCTSLESIEIPDSVTVICASAFDNCTKLTTIRLSSNLKEIGGHAFMDCSSLKEFRVPDSVTKIGDGAFLNCAQLETLVFGKGVSDIHYAVVDSCPQLRRYYISEENPYYHVDEAGVLYTKDKTKLVSIPYGFQGDYTVLPTTVEIGYHSAYERKGLTGITIPGSVRNIDDHVFSWCRRLEKVIIEEGLETIGTSFGQCTSLMEIIFPTTLKKISGFAFSGCNNLKKITFLGDALALDENAFHSVDATVYYPNGNTTWTELEPYVDGHYTKWRSKLRHYGGSLDWEPWGETHEHTFGDWVQVKAPTTEEPGVAERKCTSCDEVERKDIPKLDPPAPTEPPVTVPPTTVPPTTVPPETTVPSEPTVPATTVPVTDPTKQPTQAPTTRPGGTEAPTTTPGTEQPQPGGEEDLRAILPSILIAGALILLGGGAAGWFFVLRKRK